MHTTHSGTTLPFRSIIIVRLVALYIVVSASEGAVHMVAGVLWRFDTDQKKQLKGDLDKETKRFSLGHFAIDLRENIGFKQKNMVKDQLPQRQSNSFLESRCQTPQRTILIVSTR